MIHVARRSPPSVPSTIRQWSVQLVHQKFSDFCPVDTWSPAVNLYQLPGRIEVCVDLAGLAPGEIQVALEPGRLTISGDRPTPEPPRLADEPMKLIAMEIDHGQFRRVIALPESVDIRRVETRFEIGLLWIRLPVKARR